MMKHSHVVPHVLAIGKILALASIFFWCSGFVYIGGWGAKLPATIDAPIVKFYWNGDAPEYTGLDEFEGGAYKNLSNSEITRIIFKEAMGQWNSVKGSYLIFDLAEGPAPLDNADLQNSIPFTFTCQRTQATHPTFSKDQKTINDCDIELCAPRVDAHWFMQSMTHELGHCAGLGHPNSNYEAIMSYSNNGKVDRLGLDDMAGLTSLYPDPAFGDTIHKNIIACGTVGSLTGRDQKSLNLFLAVLPVILPLISPRRRRMLK